MAREAAIAWLAVIEDDLRQVRNNLSGPEPTATGAAYHCQQAAEKLVKAVLTAERIKFPYSHDIEALAALLPQDHSLRPRLARLAELTIYAVAYRYPVEDEFAPPSPEDLEAWRKRLSETAQAVRLWLGTAGG
jgi:HEPN domain-containing protein